MSQNDSHSFPQGSRNDSEIFIGLVAPVGTDLKSVIDIIKNTFSEFKYESSIVKMSSLLLQCHNLDLNHASLSLPEDDRIESYMKAGNLLRANTKRGDALAILAINNVRQVRLEHDSAPNESLARHAFIFDSLKHPDEILSLRGVYGENFFCFSVYSPRDLRINYLARKIARSYNDSSYEKYRGNAEKLVEKDSEEIDNVLGQSVRKTFSMSDAFIKIEQKNLMREQVRRILRIIFDSPYHTPSKDEMGMFFARAAALRSADLSRQVGAVITRPRGEMVSVGCNEVPRAGGGMIWEGERPDDRDFQKGYDANSQVRHEVLAEIYEKLAKAGWLSKNTGPKDAEEFVDKALYVGEKPVLKHTRLASIIEFGRIVHAEMHALIDAATRGISVQGCTMYTTTFPCHMCARHLVAAGLVRVVYIEPYPKSMALELYEDSISLGPGDAGWEGLILEPFVGIAPPRFIELFDAGRRKDVRGTILQWVEATATPKVGSPVPTYVESETAAALFLKEKAIEFGIYSPHSNENDQEDS